MKQLLWIGCLESDEEFKIKVSKGYDLASAQVSQQNLVKGIEQVSGITFDTINGSVLPPYPVYADRIIKSVDWSHAKGAFDISVGYKNDKYINRVNCKKAMIKAAHNWVDNHYKGGELKVLVYSMRSAPMATACYIKKAIPAAKIYLIVTDLPQFMDLSQNKLKAMLKKCDWKIIKRMQTKFDGFILYASKMAKFLEIPDDKWILMEGSYYKEEEVTSNNLEKKKAIMYSGKLDERYGIRLLLDVFMSIDDQELELWLTGSGNAETYIRECTKKDKRIKFYGFFPTRKDVLVKQKKASLLINMRLPSEEASNYCFPSKLFEYMVTGVPVLTFKLGGIPDEYYQYLFMIENENVDSLKTSIINVMKLSDSERLNIGNNAKKYILTNKTALIQSRKIVEFVEKRIENDTQIR